MQPRFKKALVNPNLKRPHAVSSLPRDTSKLWLDKNENIDPTLLKITSGLLDTLDRWTLSTYPEAGDCYRKLAEWVGVNEDQLLLTAGSDGAIRATFDALVEPGDSVFHTNPTFAMYPVYSQIFDAKTHVFDYRRGSPTPELAIGEMIDAIHRKRPKLICLPNPDSPTGTLLDYTQIDEILSTCEENDCALLLDEAYHPFTEFTLAARTASSRHLIIARTFAKAWGVAGLRSGYAIGHADTIAFMHKMRPMYETSTLATEIVTRLLDHQNDMQQSVRRIQDGKTYFLSEMQAQGFETIDTAANFVHVSFADHAAAIHKTLSNEVLYREDFGHPCLQGYSRFTMAPRDIMERVVVLIGKAIKS